jgi:ABC-2 type transport system ATP-binding protein
VNSPLDVAALTVGYDRHTVLDRVDLTVPAGGIFGLIGLNGVGKTTLIKTILDLVRPQDGRITLFGRDHRNPDSRGALAYLPEKFTPSPRLRGWEFLSLSLSYFGVKLDRAAALQMAAGFGFDGDALGRTVGTYSKGMGQKVGLIATFLSNRPLLILDEPMSGLDPQARQQLKARLEAYRAAGNTVFFSSHILADMDEICDTVAVLHGGSIRFHGTPGEMKARHGAPHLEKAFMSIIGPAG